MKTVTVEELLNNTELVPIDVRSPSEFREDTIPGAKSIPLFNDLERELVGTIYHAEGNVAARRKGFELVVPKLGALVDEILSTADGKPVVLFCWRGGLRSQSLVQMLDLIGYPAHRLEGGYKAYRKFVHDFLEQRELPTTVVVLFGLTGSGKTEIIKELQGRDLPAIDLEGLAAHRGSVFGSVGLEAQPSQKAFDTRMYQVLREFWREQYIIVEGESRRIGRLYLPGCLFKAMRAGVKVLVYDSLRNRTARIITEYTIDNHDSNKEELNAAISCLGKRIGIDKVKELQAQVAAEEFDKVVHFLLGNYYDLLYQHPDHPDPNYELSLDAGNIQQAADQLESFLKNL